MVAAAAGVQRVGLRHVPASDGVHRQDRRQEPSHRVGRHDGGHVVRVRREDRRADLPAHQGPRQRRASGARSGQAGGGVSIVSRWAQLLAGVVRPGDELRLQRGVGDRIRASAADTGAGADPAAAPRQHVPRPRQRRLRAVPPERLEGLRLDQRDRRVHGEGRMEVQHAAARAGRRDDDRVGSRLRGWRRRRHEGVRRQERERVVEVPDRVPDRLGRVDLLGRRHRVRRDHSRWHHDVLERGHGRQPASGVRSRRQPDAVSRRSCSRRCTVEPSSPALEGRRSPRRMHHPPPTRPAGRGPPGSFFPGRCRSRRGTRTRRTRRTCRGG